VALCVSLTDLLVVLGFSFLFRLDAGTTSGLAAGGLTQSSLIRTASGALAQLGLTDDELRQQQANVAAGHAATYILALIFVPSSRRG
jgi:uncharacterized transporter YbjL